MVRTGFRVCPHCNKQGEKKKQWDIVKYFFVENGDLTEVNKELMSGYVRVKSITSVADNISINNKFEGFSGVVNKEDNGIAVGNVYAYVVLEYGDC